MNPDTRPMGPRTTRPTTKYNILADLFAIHNYPLSMYEEENIRLKRLTIATAIAYVISWISGALATRLLYNEQYLWFTVNNLWVALLTVFIGAIWMPLAIFLFVQARKLKRQVEFSEFVTDKSNIALGTYSPLSMFFIYFATRLLD